MALNLLVRDTVVLHDVVSPADVIVAPSGCSSCR